ncbi:MAG: DUF4126 domain-containing protein [Deltaproteobacteria bacterium]|nr:DUF4126 domain-containing protein [Deltaproteobacteria bacterium]
MEIALSVLVGIGLSAACGFRVFVPLLVMSIASLSGHLSLAESFHWIGSWPALVAFALATAVEIAGYYVPWVDNLLDTIALPAAIVAGAVVTASTITGMSPFLRYTLAIIAGGGAAAAVKGLSAVVRAGSSVATGGIANPVVSTAEALGSVALSVLAVLLPILAALLAVAIVAYAGKRLVGLLRRRKKPSAA